MASSPTSEKTHPALEGGLAAALLLGFTALVCWPLLGSATGFGVDWRYHQFPMRKFLADQLASGDMPLWWPAIRCGYPIHAYGEGGLLYPLNAPLWSAFGVLQGSDISNWLHLALAGLGAFLLARQLGLRREGACVAALVAAAGGSALGLMGWPNASAAQANALLALAATAACVRRETAAPGSGRRVACLAALLWGAALLAGRPQRVYLLLWFVPVLSAALAWRAPKPQRRAALARSLAWSLGAVALGALVASAQILPTAELLAHSDRAAGLASSNAALGSLAPSADSARVLLLGATDLTLLADTHGEAAHFPGRITWLLLVGALVLIARRRGAVAPWIVALSALACLAAVLALGDTTPLFSLARSWVPGFDSFRAPARALAVAVLCASLLAGWALDRVASTKSWGPTLRRAVVLGLALELLAYGHARVTPAPENAVVAERPELLAALSSPGRVIVAGAQPLSVGDLPADPRGAAALVARAE
ncbi:hypothetical protein OAX78_01470, partial [Planctomycetota bacterium]|nr:hypothetical protein [Planctomycetota bacterium]